MTKTRSLGLLVLALLASGAAGPAHAQRYPVPSQYGGSTPAYGTPSYGTPSYGQPVPQPASPPANFDQPYGGRPVDQPYGGGDPYGQPYVHEGAVPPGAVVEGGFPGEMYGGATIENGLQVPAGGEPVLPYGEDFGNGPQGLGYPGVISNGGGDQLYPYDQQDPWLHGYWQEIPAYGGYAHFRPYNYKHVLAQTQAAAGWGLNPRMPYSQQFWHRYHERASLQHCPPPAHAFDNPNAELDPGEEAKRLRREVEDRQRRLRNLERNGF